MLFRSQIQNTNLMSGNNTVTLASNKTAATNSATGANAFSFGDGNNTVTDTGTKGMYVNAGKGNNTITGGSGADFVTVTNGNNTISLGGGIDTLSVGSGTNVVSLGAGADLFTLSAVNQSSAIFTTITDIGAGDILTLTSAFAGVTVGKMDAKLTSVVDDYQTFLNSAASQGAGRVSWFQHGGNTYIVEDNSAAAVFTGGADTVIKLTGLIDLSNSTLANAGFTITIV